MTRFSAAFLFAVLASVVFNATALPLQLRAEENVAEAAAAKAEGVAEQAAEAKPDVEEFAKKSQAGVFIFLS